MENNSNPKEVGNVTSGENSSCWINDSGEMLYLPLLQNLETDVVVVGGGIAGVSIAYNLVKRGIAVVIVEDGFIASGETGRTTAHLSSALDDRYYSLENLFGKDKTPIIAESHERAIQFIEDAVKEENIDCDFKRVDGYLFLHPTDKIDSLKHEHAAAQKAGLTVEWANEVPGMIMQPGKALKFARQGQFHPIKYILGLVTAINSRGGKVFTRSHVDDIDEKGVTTSDGFRVNAKHIVVATNSPINSKVILPMKQYPYRTYAIASLIRKGLIEPALWWDTGDLTVDKDNPPYHYVRTQPFNNEFDLLITGGEDHKTGLMEDMSESERYNNLEQWTREYFDIGEVVYRWSGQVLEPYDGLAFIGKNVADKDNIYVATGDSGHGMTHATIAGMLIADMIEGKENKWQEIYKPGRVTLKATKIFFKEAIGTLIDYYRSRPDTKGAESLSSIALDDAAIVEIEGHKTGAYRDDKGQLHLVSAICTHMGCTVSWNNVEKTWDCPCHGSRFSITGKVLNGPANDPLDMHEDK